MRVALDTNVLAYAEGVNGVPMQNVAIELLKKVPRGSALVPVQALGELFNLLVRKVGRSSARAHASIVSWQDTFPLIETSAAIMLGAVELAKDHRLGIWDAVILSAAAEAGCRLVLTEDLQDGFTWRSVTVTNPFAKSQHELLRALLEQSRTT